jgi:hypothetical protein
MLIKTIAAAALLTLATAPAWAVNKCTGPDGAVVFQDAPCAGKGEVVRVTGAGQADPSSQGAQYWQREAAKQKRTAAAEQNIAQRKVAIGMNADEVVASWGRPSKINKTITASGTSEQWVYEGAKFRHQYVYLDNGLVRTIQSPE